MDDNRRAVLRQNQKLLQDVTITPSFLGKLHQHNVLPEDWIESVQNKATDAEKKYTFLQLLPKGGPDAFDRFLRVLDDAGCYWIADALRDDLNGISISQEGSTKSVDKGNQCDLESDACQGLNQVNLRVIYDKMQSLFHLAEYEMNNNAERTTPCCTPSAINFETLDRCMNDISVRVNEMETDIKSCYSITGKRGEKLCVLVQKKVEEMRHDCEVNLERLKQSISKELEKSLKELEDKKKLLNTEKEMDSKSFDKITSEMKKELLKLKYENAMSTKELQHQLELHNKELELKNKEIEQLKEQLEKHIEHGEKQKTLDELRKLVHHKKATGIQGMVEGPIKAKNDQSQQDIHKNTFKEFGNSQQATVDKSQHDLSLIYSWLVKLYKRLLSETGQEHKRGSIMESSRISLETIDTEISILLRTKRDMEEKIKHYEQLVQVKDTQSGKTKAFIVNGKRGNQESECTQLTIPVKQFEAEPAEKKSFQQQSKVFLKSEMSFPEMDTTRMNETISISKGKQTRAQHTKLMGRTNLRPKAKRPAPKKKI
ncbi:hypothetical protein ACJMK2_027934 [Sinanodonta woodiana]|uniref:CARD domain-containing protein n=1 Tax=Sinanodonta woodiana TaxID=1069815 RepID=A0ABD3X619_SINWO